MSPDRWPGNHGEMASVVFHKSLSITLRYQWLAGVGPFEGLRPRPVMVVYVVHDLRDEFSGRLPDATFHDVSAKGVEPDMSACFFSNSGSGLLPHQPSIL